MAAPWQYITVGGFGGLALGTSFLSAASYLRKKNENGEPQKLSRSMRDALDADNQNVKEQGHELMDDVSSTLGDYGKRGNERSAYESHNTKYYVVGLLCALIGVAHMRSYQLWRARMMDKSRFDADAFQRGFEKFMNEKASVDQEGFNRKFEKERFEEEMSKFFSDHNRAFEERARRQREFEEQFKKHFNTQRYSDGASNDEVATALQILDLNIEDMSSEIKLRKAYLKAAQRWHPDKWPEDDRVRAAEAFKRVGWAYARLRALQVAERSGVGGHSA